MFFKINKDGHMHSHFCPHGSLDSFEMYIENALKNQLQEISFTEHFPLPASVIDPSPEKDSAMRLLDIDTYMAEVRKYQEKYQDKIKINLGFEVDFIEGYEAETKKLLDRYGVNIEDAIISTHMLNIDGELFLVDHSPELFQKILNKLGQLDLVYEKYYSSVLKMVAADLGTYKPKRVGHINLVRKFVKLFPYDYTNHKASIEKILQLMQVKNMELDYNISGLRKPYCGEIYVPSLIVEMSQKYNIPLIFGSDAHSAEYVGETSLIRP